MPSHACPATTLVTLSEGVERRRSKGVRVELKGVVGSSVVESEGWAERNDGKKSQSPQGMKFTTRTDSYGKQSRKESRSPVGARGGSLAELVELHRDRRVEADAEEAHGRLRDRADDVVTKLVRV